MFVFQSNPLDLANSAGYFIWPKWKQKLQKIKIQRIYHFSNPSTVAMSGQPSVPSWSRESGQFRRADCYTIDDDDDDDKFWPRYFLKTRMKEDEEGRKESRRSWREKRNWKSRFCKQLQTMQIEVTRKQWVVHQRDHQSMIGRTFSGDWLLTCRWKKLHRMEVVFKPRCWLQPSNRR